MLGRKSTPLQLRHARRLAGVLALALALVLLAGAVEPSQLAATLRAALRDPAGLALLLTAYAAAFALRASVWRWALPGLPLGHALAALHTSLAANHVLPFRLGEAVRVSDVVRRAKLPFAVAAASTMALRTADVLAVLTLAVLFAPAATRQALGPWTWPALLAGLVLLGVATRWLRRSLGAVARRGFVPVALLAALGAWLLESVVLWRAAAWAGIDIGPAEAVLVTAVTIAAQVLAVAPGGLGTYEAAATGALVALGGEPGAALAVAVAAHAVKTVYALATGAVALFVPAPGLLGALRLPRRLPARPAPAQVAADAPVLLFLPAHDEQDAVADVVRRAPATVRGRRVEVLVVDDGSRDDTVARAAAAGAGVLRHERNMGLGAAVRTGLAEGVRMGAAAVAFCDADGEYAPEELERLVGPILDGEADYVAGSRFAGEIRHMRPHRRLGNVALTRLLRWVARAPITDGQTGYRAFSRAAAADAEVVHDYNYAQVLTLDLLGKGYRYREVPIGYAFRQTGASFIRLGRYLRNVAPAVYRELNTA